MESSRDRLIGFRSRWMVRPLAERSRVFQWPVGKASGAVITKSTSVGYFGWKEGEYVPGIDVTDVPRACLMGDVAHEAYESPLGCNLQCVGIFMGGSPFLWITIRVDKGSNNRFMRPLNDGPWSKLE